MMGVAGMPLYASCMFQVLTLSITTLCLLCPVAVCDGGVFGCGGFVKSDVDINFSLVEVKLYAPHGSIKYSTDCAPGTGYYLIPLYDKGDYLLKPHPPKGWGFEPESVPLKVDGENDMCSKQEDINFKFTGFSIYGNVISSGQTTGPAGVDLQLLRADQVVAQGHTLDAGSFSFSNVMPGKYKIRASHSVWLFSKNEVTVEVKDDNAQVGESLTIAGYDVKGQVTGDGQPMKEVNFVLFSQSGQVQVPPKCQSGAPKGFHTKATSAVPICHVSSADDGFFTFPVVPSGSYFLIPFYKGEHITFDVEPEKLNFGVAHGSLVLTQTFEVAGFSVSGKVLDQEKGVGIPDVTILINDKKKTVSAADGSFSLENMKTGTYRLNAKVDHVAFQEMSVEITPKTPQLPSIIAAGYSMCGKVTIDRVPETLGKLSSQRRVIFYPEGKGSEAKSIITDASGAFCETVTSGKYVVKVPMTDAETKAGLTLTPSERLINVANKAVLDVTFSQFRAQISGSVQCMEGCQQMEVTLDTVGRSDPQVRHAPKVSGNHASFTFSSVMPGKYRVSVIMDSWCWKERSVEMEVTDKDLTGLEFVHTGYILKCSVSHPITINFAHNKKEKSVGSFLLDKGLNRFCLAHPGLYQLTPDSCHKFDKDNYSYDTSNPLTLTLTAIQHLALGTITTEVKAKDVQVVIRSSVDDAPTTLGPLKANLTAATGKDKDSTLTTYNFSHWARSGESLTISATSGDLLFYPESVDVFVSGDSCPGVVAELTGRKGVFIEGSVTPALEGVKVTVSAEDGSIEPIEVTTSKSGGYKVGPLHAGHQYAVAAEKEGYVLSELKSDKPHSFRAFKLGEISVQMVDEAGQSLPSVLLSLSGEKQYRSNTVTGASGHMTFAGLSPGQYFLRPMMKEYKFDPVSQQINVLEGTTEKIVIKGARVAFSCFGKVTSLNGEPEPGVIVEALGHGEGCRDFQEESKTEVDGTYRLRGLQPECTYHVQPKGGDVVNTHIERTVPAHRAVTVRGADLTDINIIAFRRMTQMDISGNIKTDLKHLSTLKVTLSSESQPDSPLHTVSMGKSTFFFLPTLTMDGKNYILSVESSLSRQEYHYKLPSAEFPANKSHRHFTFEFKPTLRSVDQELAQGSYLVLPMVALLIALAYNYKTVLPHVATLYQHVQAATQHKPGNSGSSSAASSSYSSSSSSSSSQATASMVDTSIPPEFLGLESSPVKKRVKPRKV